MRKLTLFTGLIISTGVAFGQQPEGVITYEIRINVHRTLPEDRGGMKAMVPEFRTFKQQLFFNPGESLYKPVLEEEEDEETENGGGRVRMVRLRQRVEIYCQQNTGKIITKQDFLGKDYLIDDSVRVAPWKLGSETKTVQGYECRQAFYTDEERKQTITAWYTDKLRPMLGPERFNTLPGAVLAVDINNGERVLVAIKIDGRPLRKNELKEPTRGQKTTQAELRKIMDEHMKQMRDRGAVMYRN